MAEKTLAELREDAYAAQDGDPPRVWRAVAEEQFTGFGPVCPQRHLHPGIADYPGGMEHDTEGVYDCCPSLVETFSEPWALFLAALLNEDAQSNPRTAACTHDWAHAPHDYREYKGDQIPRETFHCNGRKRTK